MASAPAPTEPPPAPAAAPEWLAAALNGLFAGLGVQPPEPPPAPVADQDRAVMLQAFRELWPNLTDHRLNPGGTEFSGLEDRGPDCKQLNIIPPAALRRKIEATGWKPGAAGAAPKPPDLPPLVKGKAGR